MKLDEFDIAIANIENKATIKKDNTYYYKPDNHYTFIVENCGNRISWNVVRNGIPVSPKKINTTKRFVRFLKESNYSYLLNLNLNEKEAEKQLSFI